MTTTKQQLPDNDLVKEFLEESNNIEDVWDAVSLLQALKAWKYMSHQKELTVKKINFAHNILMRFHLETGDRGAFRKMSVGMYLQDGGFKEFKPWHALPVLMEQWVVNANDLVKNGKKEPKEFLENLIQEHHVKFESTHPFIDGNGRIGRILMNWQRIMVGLPILVIKEKEKWEYYKIFK